MPTPARTACNASRTQFAQADRGHVRQRNNASADSRLHFTRESAAKLRSTQMNDLLGAFLTDVKNRNNLSNTKITGQTLRNYVKSATDCFSILTGSPLQIYDIATLSQKKAYLHPYLQELILQRSNWTQPKPRKEPYTYRMLANQASFLARSAALNPNKVFLQKEYVVWHWLRLGVFTGSRVSEYAQSNLRRGQRFQVVPTNEDTSIWGGQPLAFL
jgi:hypothetical protein